MRVLFLTPRLPYPPLRGDQVVAYHRLRVLGRSHDISLLSFYERDEELEGIAGIESVCDTLELVHLPRWRSLINAATRGVADWRTPLQVAYYRSRAMRQALKSLLAEREFDLVHAFFIRTAQYLDAVEIPKVLDAMDSLELRLRRQAETTAGPRRWFYREELRRVRPYEHELGGRVDHVITVSPQDAQFFPPSRVTVVPNGVDTDFFRPVSGLSPNDFSLVFTGNLGYAPNIQALEWFAKSCLPALRSQFPSMLLTAAGARPSRKVRSLERDGIHVIGEVESIPDVLNGAQISIAPMLSGSGVQNKILEALACGLPVVTTTVGLGGLEAQPGVEIVVADGAERFAAAVAELLSSPERAAELGRRGREFVLRRHSWEHAAMEVERAYEQVVGEGSRA